MTAPAATPEHAAALAPSPLPVLDVPPDAGPPPPAPPPVRQVAPKRSPAKPVQAEDITDAGPVAVIPATAFVDHDARKPEDPSGPGTD